MALGVIPCDASIEIAPADNTVLALRITETLAKVLEDRGYEISGSSEILLRFAIETTQQQLKTGPSSAAPWPAPFTLASNTIRIRVSALRPGRPPLRVGFAQAPLDENDEASLVEVMAQALIGNIGITVPEEPISFRKKSG